MADENLPLWNSVFSSATLFLEGTELNFNPKIRQRMAGQNNKYDSITKTPGI